VALKSEPIRAESTGSATRKQKRRLLLTRGSKQSGATGTAVRNSSAVMRKSVPQVRNISSSALGTGILNSQKPNDKGRGVRVGQLQLHFGCCGAERRQQQFSGLLDELPLLGTMRHRLARRPVEDSAAQQMQVQVEHRLAGTRAGVDHGSIPAFQFSFPS